MAAGMTIARDDLERFSNAFDQAVRDTLKPEDLEAAITTDGPLAPEELNLDTAYLLSIVPLVQDRLKTLKPDEVWALTSFFLVDDLEYEADSLVPRGMDRTATRAALEATDDALKPLSSFDAQTLEGVLRSLTEDLHLKTRELFGAVRVAVTGSSAAPPLFDTLAVLGSERVLHRLRHVIAMLANNSS